jgi:general secretion pathway protein A
VRYDLQPLDRTNVRVYIEHRLQMAGGTERIKFPPRACKLIYHYSAGNPRRINALCDRALLIAYTKDTGIIDGRIVKKAVKDVGEGYFFGRGQKTALNRWAPFALFMLSAIILMLSVAIIFFNFLK